MTDRMYCTIDDEVRRVAGLFDKTAHALRGIGAGLEALAVRDLTPYDNTLDASAIRLGQLREHLLGELETLEELIAEHGKESSMYTIGGGT